MKLALAIASVCALIPADLARADALSQYDDAIVSTAVADECHLVIPGQMAEEKLHATGDAAFAELLGPNTAQKNDRDKNAEDMDFVLKKRTETDLAHGRELVSEKGCSALIDHARMILEAYRK